MTFKRIPILVLLIIFIFSLTAQAAATVTPGIDKPVTSPITVTWPQVGEVWQWGTDKTITWKYSPALFKAKTVQILLLKGDTVVDTISSGAPAGANGQGSFKWNAITAAPGTGYRIKVVGFTSGTAQHDVSDYFTISDKAKITITSPQAGQVLHSGDNATITWNYTGNIGGTLFLHLVHLNGDPAGHGLFNVVIDAKTPAGSGGHGAYNWVVPDVPTGYTYTVQISSTYASTGADSPKFTIVNPKQQPTVKVISPNGGEVWHKSKTYKITWTHVADPGQKVIVTLVPSGDPAKFRKIGEAPAGTNGAGSLSWKIPADVEPGKDYKIWLANGFYNKNFIDHSDNNFTIVESVTVKPVDITKTPDKPNPGDRDKLDPQPEPPMKN